ncbi:CPBP family glutamic-type intramembrane protease [Salegentibacter salarius]|uniref:Abortive phage infection protein n=1 Tax=Salegentibacter salarius TaxID=435906 RepID=A0A2N0U5E9_9FLAO|nr:CPBP family glutamic-type intramembrane protease [Salegentibacter salarius]OEY74014.1 abortive phage infection protein [Salegentibacter salarius]PKD22214.1 abortive phage infection protein [Salegentibacter salarius]SLJ86197.1 CAAX protease self-immunity [Salegentibacter salarius]
MIGTYFLFFFLLGFLNTFLPELDLEKYQQTELFNLMDQSPLAFILMAVIIAPILEESMFRTLIKPSFAEIYIFICAVLAFVGLGFIPQEAHSLLKYGLVILSAIIIFLFLQSLQPSRFLRIFRIILYRNYRFIWLLTAALFGLVHIWNYVEGWQFDLILFLLIFPRIIAGYFFGKIKVENGNLIWPITMHAMNNGIVVFFLLPKLL